MECSPSLLQDEPRVARRFYPECTGAKGWGTVNESGYWRFIFCREGWETKALEEVEGVRTSENLRAALYAEFATDRIHVLFDGSRAHDQTAGNLTIRCS